MKANVLAFIYFSCRRHFNYLKASLQSLALLNMTHSCRVWVFVDSNDYLDSVQLRELCMLPIKINVVSWSRVTGHGVKTVYNELRAMRRVVFCEMSCDWIAKVDSDVLFIGSRVFDVVSRSRATLLGQRETEWAPLTYTQGGCYFINADWLRSQVDFTIDVVRASLDVSLAVLNRRAVELNRQLITECPEDLAVYDLVCEKGGSIAYSPYYVPTWQIPRLHIKGRHLRLQYVGTGRSRLSLSQFTGVLIRDLLLRMGYYSVVHFQYHKGLMLPVSRVCQLEGS